MLVPIARRRDAGLRRHTPALLDASGHLLQLRGLIRPRPLARVTALRLRDRTHSSDELSTANRRLTHPLTDNQSEPSACLLVARVRQQVKRMLT